MDHFKDKAVFQYLKKTYDVEFNPKDHMWHHIPCTRYYIRINIGAHFIYGCLSLKKDEDTITRLGNYIQEKIDDFYDFVKGAGRDFHYYIFNIENKAQFEDRENLYHSDNSSEFAREIYYKHNMDVLLALKEIEESTLDLYLKKIN